MIGLHPDLRKHAAVSGFVEQNRSKTWEAHRNHHLQFLRWTENRRPDHRRDPNTNTALAEARQTIERGSRHNP